MEEISLDNLKLSDNSYMEKFHSKIAMFYKMVNFNECNALYRLILDLFGKWTSVLYKIWIPTNNRYSSTCYLAP